MEKTFNPLLYESMYKLMSRYATVQNQFRLYQLNAPIITMFFQDTVTCDQIYGHSLYTDIYTLLVASGV